MGLLDNFLNDPLTQFGGLLMAGDSPFFGTNLGRAVVGAGAMQREQQKQARADQQAELAQLAGTYKILKDQDEEAKQASLWTNTPYTPNPLLKQHEAKLAQLMGMPTPSTPMSTGGAPGAAGMPSQMPSGGGFPGPSMPAQAPQQQMPQQMPAQAPQQQQPLPSLPQLAQGAGIDPRVAADWARTPQGRNELYKKLSDVYGPKVVNNVLMQLSPDGTTKFLGGAVGNDTLPVTSGRNGLQVQPIQGLQEARAAQAGATTAAQEKAKAPYTPITLPNPNGSSTTMMLDRFMGGGRQPGQPASLSVTQPPAPGSGASFGTGTSQTPGEKIQQEDLAKFYTKSFIDTQEAGKSAQKGLQNLDRIDQLMKGVDTGKLTPTGMQVSAYAKAFGFDVDPTLGNKQAAEALTSQIALELRNPSGGAGMPGALSDNDLKFLRSMTPGLAQTTEGRQMIIDTKRKTLQRDQEVAKFARDYRVSHRGQIDDGFTAALQNYADSHPLFPQATAPANGGGWQIQRVDN